MLKLRMNSIIQQQTNDSDSNYCKMPDGTLIQWGTINFLGRNDSVWGGWSICTLNNPVTFPISFIAIPIVSMTVNGVPSLVPVSLTSTTTQITFVNLARAIAFATDITYYADWIAIGRWK